MNSTTRANVFDTCRAPFRIFHRAARGLWLGRLRALCERKTTFQGGVSQVHAIRVSAGCLLHFLAFLPTCVSRPAGSRMYGNVNCEACLRGLNMNGVAWGLLILGLLLAAGAVASWRPFFSTWREARFGLARRDFHFQRERLEAKFVSLGHFGDSGPRWTDCDFDDDVAYARSRASGRLSALVAVTIEMDAMESPSFLPDSLSGDLRDATAVFHFDGKRWDTDGRAIFNLTPTQAIHFYQRDLEMVAQELVGHSY